MAAPRLSSYVIVSDRGLYRSPAIVASWRDTCASLGLYYTHGGQNPEFQWSFVEGRSTFVHVPEPDVPVGRILSSFLFTMSDLKKQHAASNVGLSGSDGFV